MYILQPLSLKQFPRILQATLIVNMPEKRPKVMVDMPGQVTVISELPNGEQAFQKLESISFSLYLFAGTQLQYKKSSSKNLHVTCEDL